MDNKFKVGDKVVRTRLSDAGIVIGGIYTVAKYERGRLWLFGHVGYYYSHYFKLVEQEEKEMTFKNMKFDVAAIAKQLNVEHEEASRIIQEALFEQGCVWSCKPDDKVQYQSADFLYSDEYGISYGHTKSFFEENENKEHTIKPTYTIVEAEEQQEIVELNGKKYKKQELEKALSLLKPIE